MRVFWWRGHPNFGDAIAPYVLDLVGILSTWSPARRAEVAVVGSVATMLPDGWAGILCGVGYARPSSVDLSKARVLALRGKLSQRQLGRPVPALGDPGLLAPHILSPRGKRHAVGIVSHFSDASLDGEVGYRIDVTQDPVKVLSDISSCERIISSSLHGLIVADAYGIERKWHRFDRVQGNGYKFLDYGTTVGLIAPGEWGRADPAEVRRTQDSILAALHRI